MTRGKILALAGGVGGAKLANGLAARLGPDELTIVVNTGDDFDHLGLRICPDVDTVTYTLAGLNNRELGWGISGETWTTMEALERLGGPAWFRLGNQDLATHLVRTQRLATETLSQVTAYLCGQLGVRHPVIPMTDDRVASIIETDIGRLSFQDYFVRNQCRPQFAGIAFDGIETAAPSSGFLAALNDPDLAAIVICPSNPVLSILPILDLPGVRDRLARLSVPVVAISPFIGGEAVKGPAAKIMRELGMPVSAAAMAMIYGDLLDAVVIDEGDNADLPERLHRLATDTLMRDPGDQARLAGEVLAFARRITDR